jgi:hypothetical protein
MPFQPTKRYEVTKPGANYVITRDGVTTELVFADFKTATDMAKSLNDAYEN